MRNVTATPLVAVALALVVSGCAQQPPVLTADMAVLKIAPTQCGAEQNPKRVKEFVESEMRKEIGRVRKADLIVLGTVSRLAPELHEEGIRTVVTMTVERCIKGSCADSTRFYVPGARFSGHDHELHPALIFRLGDRAVLLLGGPGDQGAEDDLPELRPESRYTLDHEGLVVRKQVPVEQFIAELEEIL